MQRIIYIIIFWIGYIAVLITSLLRFGFELNKVDVHMGSIDLRLDHLLHVITYFIICMYYLFGRRKGYLLFERKPLIKFILAVLLLATVTEFLQLFVPMRVFNLYDLISNLTGVGLGVFIIIVTQWRSKLSFRVSGKGHRGAKVN